MQFTKPSSIPSFCIPEIYVNGFSVVVKGCKMHPLNASIRDSLISPNSGWKIEDHQGDGYSVSLNAVDRTVVRSSDLSRLAGELKNAYEAQS